jgi:hypothetical protein
MRIIAVDAGAFVLGAALLFLFSRIRLLISLPMTFVLTAALAIVLAADILRWFVRGIRAVQIDDDGFLLERGRLPAVARIRREDIFLIRVRRFLGTKTLVIALRAPKRKLVPLIRPGRRVSIGDGAFTREDFTRLIAAGDSIGALLCRM